MDRYVTHASFTLERAYPAPPARVFAAWADPAVTGRTICEIPRSCRGSSMTGETATETRRTLPPLQRNSSSYGGTGAALNSSYRGE